MTAIAQHTAPVPASRRQRAAQVIERALRGGILGAAVAAIAFFVALALSGTVFVVLVVATIAAGAYTLMRENVRLGLWVGLAVAWAIVMLERWAVNEHGGLWVAAAAWLGVVIGARRAGISRLSLPLLAYPVLCGVIAVAADQSLAEPWGSSWLWLPAVLGPVIGARTLVRPASSSSSKST
jgi:hypothetical protein